MSQLAASLTGTEKLGRFAPASEARRVEAVVHPSDPLVRNGQPATRKLIQRKVAAHAQVKQGRPGRTVGALASEGGPVVSIPPTTAADLKAALLDSLFGTERGLNARGEARAEISELITQLEAKNPTPSPTEAIEKLSGSWKLVYTSNSALMAVLGLSRLPLVTVGDITQRIDGPSMTVENQIQITVPFSRTSFSTTASFEVRSPKRLQVKYEKGIVSTPELLEDVDLPDNVSIMGQNVDLTQAKEALQPLNTTVKDAVMQLGSIISQQPDLQIPIENERAQTWLLTTYLDDDTRISRGEGGSVYVLVKNASIVTPTEVMEPVPATPEVLEA